MLLSYISQTSADQDSFFAMMNHVHRERMDGQRCSLTPSSSTQNLARDRPASPALKGQSNSGHTCSVTVSVGLPFH